MTSTAAPADEQISEILAAARRWRRVAGWSIAVVLVAAAIGTPLWWRSAAGSMRLQEGSYSTAPGAWSIEAGPVREECFGIVPGSTLKFGVSFDNNNSRPIRLTKVDPPLEILPTTITMRQINLRSTNPEGPEQPFAPLTIEPGGEVMLLFTLEVPNDVQMSEGSHTFVGAITMSYRALNIHFEKQVPIGYWIGLDRPSPGSQPCQPERH